MLLCVRYNCDHSLSTTTIQMKTPRKKKTITTQSPERVTMGQDVYRQLKTWLTMGYLKPGEALSLRNISQSLGVSVMPVRGAVHQLVAERALEMTPQKAIRVPVLTVVEFQELTNIRIALEGMAVSIGAKSRTEEELEIIKKNQYLFSAEMDKKIPKTRILIEKNRNFHFSVYRAAHKELLMQMIETLWLRIGPILNYDLHKKTPQKIAGLHHESLVIAFETKDPRLAKKSLENDILSAAEFIISENILVN